VPRRVGLVEIDVGGRIDSVPPPGHRVARVHRKIDDDLLDLSLVGEHEREIGFRLVTEWMCSPISRRSN
jgi:hypothetical protein